MVHVETQKIRNKEQSPRVAEFFPELSYAWRLVFVSNFLSFHVYHEVLL